MTELPDAISGGVNPAGDAEPKAPLVRRIRAWAVLILVCASFLGMAVAAFPLLRTAFRPGLAVDDRVIHVMWAAGLLLPLGSIAGYFVRVRLQTGKWQGSAGQRTQERERRRAVCSTRGYPTGLWAWPSYMVRWAGYAAKQPGMPLAERASAWGVLALYAVYLLVYVAVGLTCFCMAFIAYGSPGLLVVFFAVGIVVMLIPGYAIRRLIRGVRAGNWSATREELDERRGRQREWEAGEYNKPLRSKVFSAIFCMGLFAVYFWHVTARDDARHRHGGWMTPAIFAPVVLYSIWVQFRRPKQASMADGAEEDGR